MILNQAIAWLWLDVDCLCRTRGSKCAVLVTRLLDFWPRREGGFTPWHGVPTLWPAYSMTVSVRMFHRK